MMVPCVACESFLLALRHQLYGVACDDDFLVGRNHNHLDLGVVGRENLLDAAAVVSLLVHLDAKVLQARARVPAHTFLVLADAGGPHDDVDAIHGSSVGTDVLLDAIVVHLQGQVGTLVACLVGSLYLAHVRAESGDAGHATLLVQELCHLLGSLAQLLHEIGYGRGVDVARARTHHHTSQWGQTHRGVDYLAILNGCNRGAIADVAG
jgi:hypothetical protein